MMGDEEEVRSSWCNDGGAADWHEVTPGRRHKKAPPRTRTKMMAETRNGTGTAEKVQNF
jgi:hypothetical protein